MEENSTKTPHQNDFRLTGVRGLQLIELHAAAESAGDFFHNDNDCETKRLNSAQPFFINPFNL